MATWACRLYGHHLSPEDVVILMCGEYRILDTPIRADHRP